MDADTVLVNDTGKLGPLVGQSENRFARRHDVVSAARHRCSPHSFYKSHEANVTCVEENVLLRARTVIEDRNVGQFCRSYRLIEPFFLCTGPDEDKMKPVIVEEQLSRSDNGFNISRMPDVAGVHEDEFVFDTKFLEQRVFVTRRWVDRFEIGPVGDRYDRYVEPRRFLLKKLIHIAAHYDDVCGVFVNPAIYVVHDIYKERIRFCGANRDKDLWVAVLNKQRETCAFQKCRKHGRYR